MARVLLFIISMAMVHGAGNARPESFLIIVHKSNAVEQIEAKELQDIFLKKVKFWKNGEVILPVDLPADSPVRKEFSRYILRRPVSAVRNYWQYMIFSGREVQPPEFSTGEEIVDYVEKNPNAIGYIPESTDRSRVKVITVN